MKKCNVMNWWLKQALKPIEGMYVKSQIIRNGHMSSHVFTHENPAEDLSLSHFIRILINYALLLPHTELKNEFMLYWTKLGIEIQNFAESEDVDEFNEQFASESKSHSKHPTHY